MLLERPGMLELAHGYLAEQGVADRCELVEGDFFSSVPAGGDVYVLKSVLHDWDDERCIAILQSCRAAMDPAARLAIIELLLPERMTPSGPMLSAALLDLIMLAYAGGRERTEAEFTQLLDQAGLAPGEHDSPRSGAARPRSRRRLNWRSAELHRLVGERGVNHLLGGRSPGSVFLTEVPVGMEDQVRGRGMRNAVFEALEEAILPALAGRLGTHDALDQLDQLSAVQVTGRHEGRERGRTCGVRR